MGARAYIQAEVGLGTRVVLAWRQRLREVAEKTALEPTDLVGVLTPQAEWVKFFLRRAVSAGASMVGGRVSTDGLALQQTVQDAYDRLDASLASSLWGLWLSQEETAKADGDEKLDKARKFVSFKKGAASLTMLVSALHTSRLAVFGFVIQSEMEGVTEYKLTAVIDGRTSDFCRAIHKRTFKVSDAALKIRQVLSAKSDAEVKMAQPWPPQTKAAIEELKGLSDEEIVLRGWHIPPFHPHCRTLCTAVRTEVAGPAPTPTEEPAQEPALVSEDWAALGVDHVPEDKDTWNAYVGAPLKQWLEESFAVDAEELLKKKLGKNLDMKASDALATLAIKGVQNSAKVVVDWADNRIKVELLRVKDLAFIRRVYKAQVDLAKRAKVRTVEVSADSPSMAQAHTKMGFTPTPAAWDSFRVAAQVELEEGGRLAFLRASLVPVMYARLVALLANSSPKAFWALAAMVFSVAGAMLLAHLLGNQSVAMELHTEDAESMERWNAGQ